MPYFSGLGYSGDDPNAPTPRPGPGPSFADQGFGGVATQQPPAFQPATQPAPQPNYPMSTATPAPWQMSTPDPMWRGADGNLNWNMRTSMAPGGSWMGGQPGATTGGGVQRDAVGHPYFMNSAGLRDYNIPADQMPADQGGNPTQRPGSFNPTQRPGSSGGAPMPGAAPAGMPQSPWASPQAGSENRGFAQSGLDPRLDGMFQFAAQQAMQRYNDPNGQQFYSGPQVANLTPDEIQAQEMMRHLAAGDAGNLGAAGSQYYQGTLGRALNPADDPTLQAAIDAMGRDTMRSATDPGGVFQQIRQGSIQNGTMGSSRQGIAEGLAGARIADSIGSNSAQMRLAGRGQNMQAASSAFGNTPQAVAAATLPANLLSGVGAQNRAVDQSNIDANMRTWAYNTYEPDRRLQNLYTALNGTPLGGYQATSNTVGQDLLHPATGGTSTGQNIAGGVTAGLGLWQILRNSGII